MAGRRFANLANLLRTVSISTRLLVAKLALYFQTSNRFTSDAAEKTGKSERSN